MENKQSIDHIYVRSYIKMVIFNIIGIRLVDHACTYHVCLSLVLMTYACGCIWPGRNLP